MKRINQKKVKSVFNADTYPMNPDSCSILLIAINARYSHSSYSVRTLKANLGELEDECTIYEAELSVTPLQLASYVAEKSPQVVGFSIYLWNLRIIEDTTRILRRIAPEIKLVAGGPELTADYKNAELFDLCLIGEGESALREYCRDTLNQDGNGNPLQEVPAAKNRKSVTMWPTRQPHSDSLPCKPSINSYTSVQNISNKQLLDSIIKTPPESPEDLKLPFHLYSDEDIANRVIYVEASRGCPYRCTYCTSAGTGLRLIPLETLLPGLNDLWRRGVRRFKFLDRSFTASKEHALAIMEFFLERSGPEMCLHFEVYTDILHPEIKAMIKRFPAGALHLECGVQTLNPEVAERVGRSADTDKTLRNLQFLTDETGADIHADLIFGLPGEDERSFAEGFNRMVNCCNPPVVQINLLKALPGTELSKRAGYYNLKFNSEPPYELLESASMNFQTLIRIQRLARCWELIHNRDNFNDEVKKLMALSQDVYGTFMQLAEHIYRAEGRMHRIAKPKLKELVGEFFE